MDEAHILITGCSGGGKSTLLDALAQRGFATVPEPGRRIVAAAQAGTGAALPWADPEGFARAALALARRDLSDVRPGAVTFFDRGVIDAAVALAHATGQDAGEILGDERPYGTRVYLAPPWPEIYVTDAERQHGFDAAVAEYERIVQALEALGYRAFVLPHTSVDTRIEMILADLGGDALR